MFVFLLAEKATHIHAILNVHIACEEAISVPKSEIQLRSDARVS